MSSAKGQGIRADDRLDAGLLGLDRKLQRPEEIARIRDRHRRHAMALAELDQLLDQRQAALAATQGEEPPKKAE